MRVFDFDNTIYKGESAVDFFIFYLKKYPLQVVRYVPKFVAGVIKYKSGKLGIDEVINEYGAIFRACCLKFGNIPEAIKEFWDLHERKIKPFYREIQSCEDVILSASPEVVLNEICARIGIKHIIGSDLDIEKGEIRSMCFRENKIKRFREIYGDIKIDEFYTDSYNDKPFMDISDTVYFVKGDKIEKIKENGEYLN